MRRGLLRYFLAIVFFALAFEAKASTCIAVLATETHQLPATIIDKMIVLKKHGLLPKHLDLIGPLEESSKLREKAQWNFKVLESQYGMSQQLSARLQEIDDISIAVLFPQALARVERGQKPAINSLELRQSLYKNAAVFVSFHLSEAQKFLEPFDGDDVEKICDFLFETLDAKFRASEIFEIAERHMNSFYEDRRIINVVTAAEADLDDLIEANSLIEEYEHEHTRNWFRRLGAQLPSSIP